ncbi:MAG: hypothetical protein JW862_09270, partial [Anaerolineales bacterium]|nr:hypothetical protein [Anaerolineales bacterium]
FALEARHQALFRKEARKSGKKFFSAPRIYARLSSEHVIVEEFAAGMWLWEVLAAVEQHDPQALQRMRELNIQPRRVARRLMWVNAWGLDEYLLFRAELRPDNVIVQANSQLCFLDFSSVGVLGRERREAVQQIMANAARRDPLEMARESLVLLEPLPPLDVLAFTHDLESAYWQYLYGLESRQVAWWERTSTRLWLGFVQTARAHRVTLSIQVLRLIRSCLQHDLLAARLSPGLDHERQYRRFGRTRARQARQRLAQQAAAQFDHGLQDRFFLEVEGLARTGERLFRQLQRSLAKPMMKFNAVLDKPVYVLTILLRWLVQLLLVSTLGLGMGWLIAVLQDGLAPALPVLLRGLLAHPLYWLVALFVTATNLRMVLFRLGDKDV